MQSIEVISDTEYVANIHVKLAFISAKFKMRTLITEMRAPHYLCSESTGEDASVASSLKSTTEVFITQQGEGQTELRLKVKVDLFGRLGSFGMNAMKTKADRMWDEFSKNMAAQLDGTAESTIAALAPAKEVPAQPTSTVSPPLATTARVANVAPAMVARSVAQESWWHRLLGQRVLVQDAIHIEIRRGDTSVSVSWPQGSAKECTAWLLEYLK
jgi:carbon monoxide dehydrogenase subunit G